MKQNFTPKKITKTIYLLCFFLLFLSTKKAFAQLITSDLDSYCGTIAPDDYVPERMTDPNYPKFRDAFIQKLNSKKGLACDTIYEIPVMAHIINQDDGTGGLSAGDYFAALDRLNTAFAPACMSFYQCGDINFINNSVYFDLTGPESEILIPEETVDAVVNLYFVNTFGSCGLSSLGVSGGAWVYLNNGCVRSGTTLEHEMGHFFTLQHTHGPDNDVLTDELVDGSNCATAGDGFCDTPADPNLFGKTTNCVYNLEETDANGDIFQPNEDLLMSYAPNSCRGTFSDEQYAAMNYHYLQTADTYACSSYNPCEDFQQAAFASSTLSHSGTGANAISYTFSTLRKNVAFTIIYINSNLSGNPSKQYNEKVSVTYLDENGVTQNYGEFMNVNSVDVNISVASKITVTLTDGQDGDSGSSTMLIGLRTISSCLYVDCNIAGSTCDDGDPCTTNDTLDENCFCSGTYADGDNDGVCDANDICLSGDDAIDVDSDGIPDACDSIISGACNACATVINSFPHIEDFEGSLSVCQFATEDFDWTVNSAGTSSTGTGPSAAYEGANYFYTEASSPNFPSKTASFQGGCYDLSGAATPSIDFWYHMYGAAIGTLSFEISTDNGQTWTSVWALSGQQGTDWLNANIDLSTYIDNIITYRFVAITGDNFTSDFAIDQITVDIGSASCKPGIACNDNDACTTGDVYDNDCNCAGTFVDSDWDGVCDAEDICPDGDDTIDVDNNGIPDACDSSGNTACNGCLVVLDNFPHVENFESSLSVCQYSDEDFDWVVNSGGTSSNGTGPSAAYQGSNYFYAEASSPNFPSKTARFQGACYDLTNATTASIDFWYHMYGAAMGTLILEVSTNSGASWTNVWSLAGNQGTNWLNQNIDLSAYVGNVLTYRFVGVTANDFTSDFSLDQITIDTGTTTCNVGTACNDNDACTTGDVYDANCNCLGTFADADNDGVCDANDICPNGDDSLDSDNDGIPDACDSSSPCSVTNTFSASTLQHSGTGSSTSSLSLVNQADPTFTITGLNARQNGNPSRRYIEIVEVSYVNNSGTTIVYGTYSGADISSVTVAISGVVKEIIVKLSDGHDGDSPAMSVDLSYVTSCNISAPFGKSYTTLVDDQQTIMTYPNPSADEFQLHFDTTKEREYTVFVTNLLGMEYYRNVLTPTTENAELTIDCGAWKGGIYFIWVQYGEEMKVVKHVVLGKE